jgi:hypothetical protein
MISFNCTTRGKPLRTISIPKQAFLCLTIDDGQEAASPKKKRGWKNESYRARAASEVERGVRVRGI